MSNATSKSVEKRMSVGTRDMVAGHNNPTRRTRTPALELNCTDNEQKLSTQELEYCTSRRDIQSHGPDDFYQLVVNNYPYRTRIDCASANLYLSTLLSRFTWNGAVMSGLSMYLTLPDV